MIDTNRGLSVITNFGCPMNCTYCIWKTHPLRDVEGVNIENLPALLERQFYHLPKFSISGGGDPLHEFDVHFEFWREVTTIAKFYDKKIDIHTALPETIFDKQARSEESLHYLFRDVLSKLVIHIPTTGPNKISSLYQYYNSIGETLRSNVRVRFVIVENSELSLPFLNSFENMIKEYISPRIHHPLEICYRELVKQDGMDSSVQLPDIEVRRFLDEVHTRHPKGRFVRQNDYNYYIMPDGTLTDEFLPS